MSENTKIGQKTREKLIKLVERIERLEAEKTELAADIREVYAEAKVFGLDPKVVRKVVSKRKQDAADRAEMEALEEMYFDVLEGGSPAPERAEEKPKKDKKKKKKKGKKSKKK